MDGRRKAWCAGSRECKLQPFGPTFLQSPGHPPAGSPVVGEHLSLI